MSDGPVLHWLASRGFGGMEKLVTLIHGEMRRQGVDSRLVFTTQDASERVAKLLGPGDHAVWCGSTLGLLRQLPTWKPSHLVHHSGHSLHWMWAARMVRPGAAHHRCFHLGFGAKHDLLHRWTYARLRTCVFPTERSRSDGLRLLPISPQQTVVEPYGVRVPSAAPAFSANMSDQRIILVSMSRIDPGKGQLELVRAFAAACAAEPRLVQRLQLRLFGHHDAWDPRHVAYHRDLVAAISAANLGDAIELRGHTDDPDGELRQAHALVFTSIDEFFGLALIEAYANGVPAICVRRGSFTELHHDDRGLWLDLEDPLPGLRAIADLAPERHAAMRVACRERALAYRLEDRVAALVRILTR